jgi:outer membrane lipoprotein-sorting protein
MRFGQMTGMNRRAALLVIASLAALAAPAAAQTDQLRPRTDANAGLAPVDLSGGDRDQGLARANAALNAVQRLQGHFTQTAPDHRVSSGTFYMQRPGKLRFEYDPPAALLIISDGNVVAQRNQAMRTTDRTPLRSTPLYFLLRGQVDLAHDAHVTRVARAGDWLMVSVVDRMGLTDGRLTLFFYGPDTEFRCWDVVDATGSRTRVMLSDLTQPASFDQSLFQLDDTITRSHGPH